MAGIPIGESGLNVTLLVVAATDRDHVPVPVLCQNMAASTAAIWDSPYSRMCATHGLVHVSVGLTE